MAMFGHDFPRAGGDPDLAALATAIRPTLGDPFYLGVSPGFVTIQKPTAWSGGDITTVQAAVTACPAASPQTDAQNAIDSLSIFEKAIILTIIDQLNILRAFHALGAITPAAAVTAVRAKAGTL
jgi:hypothetical protein